MGLFDGAAGGIFSGAASLIGQERANRANAELAGRQMEFQRHMSNTAHEREVRDLRRAGLNPILSATGGQGASTPAGASAVMENSEGAAATSAIEALRLRKEIQATAQEIETSKAVEQREKATAKEIDARTPGVAGESKAKETIFNQLTNGMRKAFEYIQPKAIKQKPIQLKTKE